MAITETLPCPNSRIASRIAALHNLALAHSDGGNVEEATSLVEQSLALWLAVGHRRREAALRNNLADLLHAADRDDEAMTQLKQVVAIFAEIGEKASNIQLEIEQLTEW